MMNSADILKRITSNWPVKILSLVAAIILYLSYRIGTLEERFFSVPLEITTLEEFVPVGDIPESVRVSLRGQSEDIFLILAEDIEAYVDLTEHTRSGQYRVPVAVRKSGAAQGFEFEIRVEPLEVTVTQERILVQRVEIHPSIRGFPADGFELSEYSVQPPSIEVTGPESMVELVTVARTVDIDLSGRAADFSVRTRVTIEGADVDIVGSNIVEFIGVVKPVVVARFFRSVAITLVGLPDSLEAIPEIASGDIRARGTIFDLDRILASEISLSVDCSDITGPGSYELPVIARMPSLIEVLSVQPQNVVVEVIEPAPDEAGVPESEEIE